MPFVTAWTDDTPQNRALSTLRWHWEKRAALRTGVVDPALPRPPRRRGRRHAGVGWDRFRGDAGTVATGSWLGLRHQRRGIGTEMRAAVLLFAFDHSARRIARSAAFVDNPASLRVSEKLGYRRDGTESVARRGRLAEDVRLLVARDTFRRPTGR
jgi:RimJ/RimL family protein N-acetyltransferase